MGAACSHKSYIKTLYYETTQRVDALEHELAFLFYPPFQLFPSDSISPFPLRTSSPMFKAIVRRSLCCLYFSPSIYIIFPFSPSVFINPRLFNCSKKFLNCLSVTWSPTTFCMSDFLAFSYFSSYEKGDCSYRNIH